MKVIDLCKRINRESDPIPVRVQVGNTLYGEGESLYQYGAHGGLELDRAISRITIKHDLITIWVK